MGYGAWASTAFLFLQFLAFSSEPTKDEIDPKSIIRTIVSNDGQIFVCVRFMLQPSLQHPLLNNHIHLQMQLPAGGNLTKFSNPSAEMSKIECPPRTVPILISYNGSTANRPFDIINGTNWNEDDRRGYIAAVATIQSTLYASYSEISVWEPDLGVGKPPRFSGAITTMQMEENQKSVHYMRAGLWIHISMATIVSILRFDGDQQNANWCLSIGDEFVGYWPKELFRYMSEAASMVGWVGAAEAAAGEPYPPMGSGEPPASSEGRAAFFDRAKIVDQSKSVVVPDLGNIFTQTTDPNCYRVGRTDMFDEGLHFYFGGPGCMPN
ncbi:hypothetical protein ACP70R_001661 [Stipagrostis hirtigluma subsp. patula]